MTTTDGSTVLAARSAGSPEPRVRRWWATLAGHSARSRSDALLVVLDAVLVVVAYLFMLLARYDLSVPTNAWGGLWVFLPIAVVCHVTANWAAGLYGPVWEQASILEAQRLLVAGMGTAVALTLSLLFLPRFVPLSVALVGGAIAMGLLGLLRFQSRLFAFRRRSKPAGTRVLLVGAGESAGALLREIDRLEDGQVRPVALLDDDPRKHGRRLGDVPILGPIDELVAVGRDREIEQVLLAIPSAPSSLVRRVADACAALDVPLKVLPGVNEFINGHPQLRDVRDLSIDDLLGRQQVTTDMALVTELIRDRTVVITGGGGSIGAEIARQVARIGPRRLVLIDRDETHLFDAVRDLDTGCDQVLLDIRDEERLTELFVEVRPDIVFHAAANKHVPILEDYPSEAASTNVFGTANVVAAARAAHVERFVFVSTDKAVNPSSVMGASKRVGEQLVLTGVPEGGKWCAVRFGNVLGSRGSVVPTFMQQIRRGGPVTVTHPDVTRFFMSIPEAVQLVLQAGALASGNEVFMLDMGEPVRIVDLANRMISLVGYRAGVDMQIDFTGLRPGEKLVEELNSADEKPEATQHPKVFELQPTLVEPTYLEASLARLAESVRRRDDDAVRSLLFAVASNEAPIILIPDYQPVSDGATSGHDR